MLRSPCLQPPGSPSPDAWVSPGHVGDSLDSWVPPKHLGPLPKSLGPSLPPCVHPCPGTHGIMGAGKAPVAAAAAVLALQAQAQADAGAGRARGAGGARAQSPQPTDVAHVGGGGLARGKGRLGNWVPDGDNSGGGNGIGALGKAAAACSALLPAAMVLACFHPKFIGTESVQHIRPLQDSRVRPPARTHSGCPSPPPPPSPGTHGVAGAGQRGVVVAAGVEAGPEGVECSSLPAQVGKGGGGQLEGRGGPGGLAAVTGDGSGHRPGRGESIQGVGPGGGMAQGGCGAHRQDVRGQHGVLFLLQH